MLRLFVAIRPPRSVRADLLALMGGIAGARWQNEDQLHLTLRFIGEVDRHRATDLADALAKVRFRPFAIALSGIGLFDRKGRVDTLWAGISPHDPLAHLHRKVDRACVLAGERAEDRAYLPHVTLARFGRSGGATDDFIARHAALSSDPFPVDSFGLYESRLGHDGPVYHRIETYRAETVAPKP